MTNADAEQKPSRAADVMPRGIRGWWRFGRAVWHESIADQLPLLAAGVAFFAFVSIFPTLLAAGLVYGLVSNPEQVQLLIDDMSDALPGSAESLISDQLTRLVNASQRSLGIGLVVALAVAMWGASTATSNLISAVNSAYDHTLRRNFVRRRALALLMTAGGIAFMTVAVALVAILPVVREALDPPNWVMVIVQIGRWGFLVISATLALAVLYRFAPFRAGTGMQWVTLGAVVAMPLWLAASAGFSFYVGNFGTNYQATYGPQLAGAIVLMLWLWLSALAALLGAEANAELERRRRALSDPAAADDATSRENPL